MKYCPECGHKLDRNDYTLCPHCGTRLKFASSPMEGSEVVECAHCNGTGTTMTKGFWNTAEPCAVCGGAGVVRV